MSLHWIATLLLAAFLLWSSWSYVYSAAAIQGFEQLGFPHFFRWQLVVLKLAAVVVLLVPAMPNRIKEWCYAGIGLFLLTATVAHIAHKDSWLILGVNGAFFGLLIVAGVTAY